MQFVYIQLYILSGISLYQFIILFPYKIYIQIPNIMFQQSSAKYLITLKDSTQQQKYTLIQQKLSKHSKYFFDTRSKTLLIYDNTLIYIISNEQTKITDLGKQYTIIQLIYNPIPNKNILIFLTHDGILYVHFINFKTQFVLKKDIKKQNIFGWIYGRAGIDLFIAQNNGIKLYKVQQQKKAIKQIKSISAKYNSFLYQPKTQILICFPYGDCKTIQTFLFDQQSKAKNWFKGPQISINIQSDQNLKLLAKKNKNLGLHSSLLNYQLFHKHQTDQLQADVMQINNKCYLVFYICSQGKLKLNAICQQPEKQIIIKLPSDCLPAFNVVDNMLVIHMNNQKITFIYDINNSNAQMLVSPFPVEHMNRKINPYIGIFRGSRHIMPDGNISKWIMYIPSIFYYLKNQLQIFDFLIRRQKAKPQLLKWLRQNLMRIKQINLSKFWKLIFVKMLSTTQKQSDILTLSQLYTHVFNILANDELTPKQPLLNTIIQCIRQAKQMQIKITYQLQKLIFDLLLDCNKYDMLVFLCHNDIIKDSQELVQNLMRKANKQNQQILLTLAIDMANRVCKPQKVFEMLVLSQNIWQARRYLKQKYQQIQVLYMIYVTKAIQDSKIRQEFIRLVRIFILKKFPDMNQKYLNEMEEKIKNGSNFGDKYLLGDSESNDQIIRVVAP